MSNSGLYSLNKDELIKIISTVNYSEQEERIKKLTNDYKHLIQQCNKLRGLFIYQCDICERFDLFDDYSTSNMETCNECGLSYHYECQSICRHCSVCSDCNSVVNYTYCNICDNCNTT